MVKAIIHNQKVSVLHHNGSFYDTNKYLDIPFSDALRMSRLANVELYTEIQKYNPDTFHKDKKLSFVSDIDVVSGWGNVSLNLIKHSSSKYNISQIGRLLDVHDISVITASRAEIDPASAVILHEQPKASWDTIPFDTKIAIVPFETTIIPASWIPRINRCKALLVPCQQNVDAFRDSGVTVPIGIIHWGIDEKKFYPIEREDDGIFTFGTMGSLSIRKGTDILTDAFIEAFPTEKDVRLICKTSQYMFPFAKKDRRVVVEMTPIDHNDLMNNFFKKTDCFVFPTRGEGFGLTPLEAMATGIPAIVTGWSGPAEYMTPEIGWTIDYTMSPAKDFTDTVYKENCGDWAEPSKEHLIKLMRYAYEHQDEVKEKGKQAAKHIQENWTWSKKIDMFHQQLEKYL